VATYSLGGDEMTVSDNQDNPHARTGGLDDKDQTELLDAVDLAIKDITSSNGAVFKVYELAQVLARRLLGTAYGEFVHRQLKTDPHRPLRDLRPVVQLFHEQLPDRLTDGPYRTFHKFWAKFCVTDPKTKFAIGAGHLEEAKRRARRRLASKDPPIHAATYGDDPHFTKTLLLCEELQWFYYLRETETARVAAVGSPNGDPPQQDPTPFYLSQGKLAAFLGENGEDVDSYTAGGYLTSLVVDGVLVKNPPLATPDPSHKKNATRYLMPDAIKKFRAEDTTTLPDPNEPKPPDEPPLPPPAPPEDQCNCGEWPENCVMCCPPPN
jgi:hypothetical protein